MSGHVETPPTSPPQHGILRSLLRVVLDFAKLVFVEPVRKGRLRPARWPSGLWPIGVVALAGYAAAVLAVVLAGPLRAALPLSVVTGNFDLSAPALIVGPVFALVVLALALAQTAALHTPLWLAVTVTATSALVVLFIGAIDGGVQWGAGRFVSLAASLALVVILVVRRRRRFAWGEFALVFAVIAAGVATPLWLTSLTASKLGIDTGLLLLAGTLQNIGAMAAPIALAAGAAVVQLACTMATASAESVRRHLPHVAGFVILLALTLWRLWVAVSQLLGGEVTAPALIAAAALLLATVGAWMLLSRLRGAATTARPAELEASFGRRAQPIAILLVIGVFPATFVYTAQFLLFAYTGGAADVAAPFTLAGAVLSSMTVTWAVRLVVGVGLLWLAVRGARRQQATVPELYAAMGVVITAVSLMGLLGVEGWVWTPQSLTVLVTAGTVGMLLWWLLRRTLTAERGAAVGVALLIAALFDQRGFAEDPLQALFGFTGFAFVLFGFLWTLLTGAEAANGTSRRYPRSTRVLFFLANSLFGVTVLAFAALIRDPAFPIDIGPLTSLGDQLLGTGLLTAALLASLAAAIGIGRARPQAPEPGPKAGL